MTAEHQFSEVFLQRAKEVQTQLTENKPLRLKRWKEPINGTPVGDYDTVIDVCGVEWFFDQSGHLDVIGSNVEADEGLSGYVCRSLDDAIEILTEEGYIEPVEVLL